MTIPYRTTDTGTSLTPNSARVITRFFVPGREEVGPGDSRAAPVLERILALAEVDVELAMHDINQRFMLRHRVLHEVFIAHCALVSSRLGDDVELSPARRLLLGASFTNEYSIEAAALCNPSAVLRRDQPGNGDAAFILSVRGIGEGHRSSIGFRTGVVTAAGVVTIDEPGPFPETAQATPGHHDRSVFHAKLAEIDDDRENAAFVLDAMPPRFDDDALDERIGQLEADGATRRNTAATVGHLRRLARSSYTVEFPASTHLSERVLWPQAPLESHGMEDARFVRFIDDDGSLTYYATYTAFDGVNVSQQLLETQDFTTFVVSPIAGRAATGKGLALFPRKIAGRYAALSRSDRETNAVATSANLRCWDDADVVQLPGRSWDMLQLGNCGSPIETAVGWLVLMHGVGPMRTYSLGALLLDLDDPRRLVGTVRQPIIGPDLDRRDGYVPNVVYSCGSFVHQDILVLPYGVGDQMIRIATMSVSDLLSRVESVP